jgi:hypothetical protein
MANWFNQNKQPFRSALFWDITQRSVRSQKSVDVINIVAEAWNQSSVRLFLNICNTLTCCKNWILAALENLRKATTRFVCPSARPPAPPPPAWNNSAPTGRIFMKFGIWVFSESVAKIQVSLKCDKNNGNFTWKPMYIHDNISLIFSQNERCFREKF